MKLDELKIGSIGTVEGVIMAIEEKTNKNNGAYLDITLCDGITKTSCKKWNTRQNEFPFAVGQAAFFEVKADDFNGNKSYIVRDVMASSADPAGFICCVPVNAEAMFSFLLKTAEKCGVYAPVVTNILKANKDQLLYWAGGKTIHHNMRGGLLYHMYRMAKVAAYTANVYNKEPNIMGHKPLNTELLVAGTILHDIGKLAELETNQFGSAENTVKGSLMGHAFIGAELVGRYASAAKLDEEDTMLLQHMILSHHGKMEYGASVQPAIPEAMILHHIDMMDAQIWQFEAALNAVQPGEMSKAMPGLGNKAYRPTWLTVKDAQPQINQAAPSAPPVQQAPQPTQPRQEQATQQMGMPQQGYDPRQGYYPGQMPMTA